jgi:hypothetical protein
MTEYLSPHFTLQEMTASQIAVRLGINNTPPPGVIENLTNLCTKILEPIRVIVGYSIYISSGYRSHELNDAIGGSKNSQHCLGQAADIHVNTLTTEKLYDLIKYSNVPYDQLICEFPDEGGWVHVSYSTTPRRECLIADMVNGKVKYYRDAG